MTRNALIATVLLFFTSTAGAKEITDARAREQFETGRTAYVAGDYERALSAFATAYARQPIPSLLFDIAQCHRRLGNYETAAVFYQQYLELSPGTPNAGAVRALLTEVQTSERERKRRIADGDTVRRAILKSSQESNTVAAVDAAKRPPAEVVGIRAVDDSSIFQRWWFWTGAGAIALGTTAYILATHATAASPELLVPSRAR